MAEQIVDITEASMPASSDVVAQARSAGGAAGMEAGERAVNGVKDMIDAVGLSVAMVSLESMGGSQDPGFDNAPLLNGFAETHPGKVLYVPDGRWHVSSTVVVDYSIVCDGWICPSDGFVASTYVRDRTDDVHPVVATTASLDASSYTETSAKRNSYSRVLRVKVDGRSMQVTGLLVAEAFAADVHARTLDCLEFGVVAGEKSLEGVFSVNCSCYDYATGTVRSGRAGLYVATADVHVADVVSCCYEDGILFAPGSANLSVDSVHAYHPGHPVTVVAFTENNFDVHLGFVYSDGCDHVFTENYGGHNTVAVGTVVMYGMFRDEIDAGKTYVWDMVSWNSTWDIDVLVFASSNEREAPPNLLSDMCHDRTGFNNVSFNGVTVRQVVFRNITGHENINKDNEPGLAISLMPTFGCSFVLKCGQDNGFSKDELMTAGIPNDFGNANMMMSWLPNPPGEPRVSKRILRFSQISVPFKAVYYTSITANATSALCYTSKITAGQVV